MINMHHKSKLTEYKLFGCSSSIENFVGIGFELEIDTSKDNDNQFKEQLANILTTHSSKEHYMLEEDSSLKYGLELITQPHDVETMLKFVETDMTDILKTIKSHTSAEECLNAGLHIHISKTMFGNAQEEQIERIAKLLYMLANNHDTIMKVGRKSNYDLCFAPPTRFKKNALEYATLMINRDTGYEKESRYMSLNLKNKRTVEFRAMRTALNIEVLLAEILFTLHLVNKSAEISWDVANNFNQWMIGAPAIVTKYLKNQQRSKT